MMGMDCINQQTAQDRDCSHCIWHTDGRCASWDCEYISRAEALEALEKVKNATPMVLPPEQPEIVRCKDCEFWREHKYAKETKRYLPFCELNAIYTKSDDFCSWAERRTDEQT